MLLGSPAAGYAYSFEESGRPHGETDDAEDQGSAAASCQWAVDTEDRREPRRRQSTASDYLKRVERAGLSWPLAAEMTDAALEALLFHPSGGPT